MPIVKNNKNLDLLGYSETYYPEEQTSAIGDKFSNIRNKKSFRIDNKHKIIIDINGDGLEYYNVDKDPNELDNIIN